MSERTVVKVDPPGTTICRPIVDLVSGAFFEVNDQLYALLGMSAMDNFHFNAYCLRTGAIVSFEKHNPVHLVNVEIKWHLRVA